MTIMLPSCKLKITLFWNVIPCGVFFVEKGTAADATGAYSLKVSCANL
jgi:hypothetical protein